MSFNLIALQLTDQNCQAMSTNSLLSLKFLSASCSSKIIFDSTTQAEFTVNAIQDSSSIDFQPFGALSCYDPINSSLNWETGSELTMNYSIRYDSTDLSLQSWVNNSMTTTLNVFKIVRKDIPDQTISLDPYATNTALSFEAFSTNMESVLGYTKTDLTYTPSCLSSPSAACCSFLAMTLVGGTLTIKRAIPFDLLCDGEYTITLTAQHPDFTNYIESTTFIVTAKYDCASAVSNGFLAFTTPGVVQMDATGTSFLNALVYTIGDFSTDFTHSEVTNSTFLRNSCTLVFDIQCPFCQYFDQLFLNVTNSASVLANAYPDRLTMRINQGSDNLGMENNGQLIVVIAYVFSQNTPGIPVANLTYNFHLQITKNCNPGFIQIQELPGDPLAQVSSSIAGSTTVQASLASRTKAINRMTILNPWNNKYCLGDFDSMVLLSAELQNVYSNMFSFSDPGNSSVNPTITFIAEANSFVSSPSCKLSTKDQILNQASPITYTQFCQFKFEVKAKIGAVLFGPYSTFDFKIYNECLGLTFNQQPSYELWHFMQPNPNDPIQPLDPGVSVFNVTSQNPQYAYLPKAVPMLTSELLLNYPTAQDECGPLVYKLQGSVVSFTGTQADYPTILFSPDLPPNTRFTIDLSASLLNFPSVPSFSYQHSKSPSQPSLDFFTGAALITSTVICFHFEQADQQTSYSYTLGSTDRTPIIAPLPSLTLIEGCDSEPVFELSSNGLDVTACSTLTPTEITIDKDCLDKLPVTTLTLSIMLLSVRPAGSFQGPADDSFTIALALQAAIAEETSLEKKIDMANTNQTSNTTEQNVTNKTSGATEVLTFEELMTNPNLAALFARPKSIQEYLKVPLNLHVTSMSEHGVLRLDFNRPVMLNIDYFSGVGLKQKGRGLMTSEEQSKKVYAVLKNAFTIKYVPAPGQFETTLIDFEVIAFKDQATITMKLNFTDPLVVSYNSFGSSQFTQDHLLVSLSDSAAFIDPRFDQTVNPVLLQKESVYVPKQIPDNLPAVLDNAIQTAQEVATVVLPGVLVTNLLLGVSLKKLWTAIGTLQFLIYVEMWAISPPSNLNMMFGKIAFFARGDWIPKDVIMQKLKCKASDPQERQKRFLILVGVSIGMTVLLAFGLALICKYCSTWLTGLFKKLISSVFWNGVIRYVLQSYLDFVVSVWLVIALRKKSNSIATYIWTAIQLLVYFACPIGCYFLLHKRKNTLWQQEVQDKIGTLYEGISHCRESCYLSYSVIFLARRFMYAFVSAFVGSFDGGLTLALVTSISLAYLIYCAHYAPNERTGTNRIELLSETLLAFTFYVIMQCELISDPHVKHMFGWTGAVFIVILVVSNVVYLLIDPIIDVYRRIKFFFQRKRALKQLEEINKEKERRALESPFSLKPSYPAMPKRIHIRQNTSSKLLCPIQEDSAENMASSQQENNTVQEDEYILQRNRNTVEVDEYILQRNRNTVEVDEYILQRKPFDWENMSNSKKPRLDDSANNTIHSAEEYDDEEESPPRANESERSRSVRARPSRNDIFERDHSIAEDIQIQKLSLDGIDQDMKDSITVFYNLNKPLPDNEASRFKDDQSQFQVVGQADAPLDGVTASLQFKRTSRKRAPDYHWDGDATKYLTPLQHQPTADSGLFSTPLERQKSLAGLELLPVATLIERLGKQPPNSKQSQTSQAEQRAKYPECLRTVDIPKEVIARHTPGYTSEPGQLK